MKIVKKILLVVVLLIALVLIIAIFVKKDYKVQREITINKPKQEVFDYIKILKNQSNYNTWVMMDPNVKIETKGTDGTVGFISSWESDKAGKGEQVIKNIIDGKQLDIALHFIKPFEGDADSQMITDSVGNSQTKIQWTFSGKMHYPMNIMTLFSTKMMSKDMDSGLNRLKVILEK